MNVTLIRIDAQDASGAAVPVFLASHDLPEACHLSADPWEPALARLPDFALDFFGGAFAGQVTAPRTSFAAATIGLAAFGATPATRARFADARCRIWVGDITSQVTADLGPLTLRFDGRITGEPEIDDRTRTAIFDAAVQDSWADKPLLPLFAGTGGIEGPADLTGQPKPLVLGNARFCGGVLIDNVDNIWMVSGGAVQAVNAVYDRLASLGASAGNFADLAALKAAAIPNGSWGTCLALGLVRLGAPPDGRVSFDVSGSNSGTGGYVRRPGAIIRRIADLAGGTVNAASLAALDTARPYNLQLQLREQVTAREIIGQLADSVGAVAGVNLRGELFAQALTLAASGAALNADDSSDLRVAAVEELAKAAPNWRLATEAELTFELHSADEAAFDYRWQGEYSAARVYRLDDVVTGPDGAAWAYIAANPAAGTALPVWPATSNASWQLFQRPGSAGVAPANANRVPFSRMEGDKGWVVQFDGAGIVTATQYDTFQGMRFFKLLASPSAPSQTISLGGLPSGLPAFRLTPNERISVQARVELAGAAGGSWSLVLWGFRADGSQYPISPEPGEVSSGGIRFIGSGFVQFFVTVPSDVVSGRMELYGFANAAGVMQLAISEPMITSAAPGQTVHPPFSPGPNAFDGATVGAPAGTLVGGVLAEALVAQAAQAASDATAANAAALAANTAISVITSDGFLSRDEKPEIRKQRDAIIGEYPSIRARAVAFGIAVSNYDADYTALIAYLGGLDLGGATDTAITRATFNTFFVDYYAERQAVLDGIAAATANTNIVVDGSGIISGIGTANIPVDTRRVPLGNVNRLPFTRFEGSRGWNAGAFLILFQGRYFICLEPAFSAANQDAFFFNTSTMPVIPGERLSISTRIQAFALPGGANPSFWQIYVDYLDAGGGSAGSSPVASGTSAIGENVRHEVFATVPPTGVTARLVLQYKSSAAGPARMAFLEPMITSATANQTVHPPYSPGPNASDGADPNNLITIDGAGIISGIGTASINVDNRRTILSGPIAARPASGAFIGQSYAATDTGEITQWDGFNWRTSADITFAISGPADVALNYDSALNLTSPLPVTATYQLAAAGSGSITSGVTWGVNVASGNFAGAAPSIVGTGSGQLRIHSAMTSPTAELRITASFGGRTYPLFTVKISRNVAAPSNPGGGSGGTTVSAALGTIATSSFSRMHGSDLTITLPAGVTSVSLVASGALAVDPSPPVGGSTVEGKWQRESSPGVWSDVGAVATSSPVPFVSDTGLLDGFGQPVYQADEGSISCNRTASGLAAGSTQKFRFVARVSSGNVRVVTGSGNVSATA